VKEAVAIELLAVLLLHSLIPGCCHLVVTLPIGEPEGCMHLLEEHALLSASVIVAVDEGRGEAVNTCLLLEPVIGLGPAMNYTKQL
jgi:hypothetical protein